MPLRASVHGCLACCGARASDALRAALQFGLAWWIYIDGAAWGAGDAVADKAAGYHWLPGLGCTIAFIMCVGAGAVRECLAATLPFGSLQWSAADTCICSRINGMRWQELSDETPSVATRARCFLISAMIIALGCISASLFIMVEVFINDTTTTKQWTGISVFIQCLFIFVAYVRRRRHLPATRTRLLRRRLRRARAHRADPIAARRLAVPS